MPALDLSLRHGMIGLAAGESSNRIFELLAEWNVVLSDAYIIEK
jgi:hypothetical protein